MLEIRFHGRGGQGAVTAALLLAEAAWIEGLWSQKIPVYTTDRRGAPVTAYLRLDKKPIRRTSFIYEPDYVVVIDERLLDFVNVTEGLKDDGTLIINNRLSPEKISLDHSISNLATIDATGISRGLFGPRPLPITNTAMLGALSKVTELVKLDSINYAIKNLFKEDIAELNAKAARIGYDSVSQVKHNE